MMRWHAKEAHRSKKEPRCHLGFFRFGCTTVPHHARSSFNSWCQELFKTGFNSYNGSGTVARTRHTDWRPTDIHTRTVPIVNFNFSTLSPEVLRAGTYL